MSSFMVLQWGKLADKSPTGCGLPCGGRQRILVTVCKTATFHTLFTPVFQTLTHTVLSIFTGVAWPVLLITHTPNKDNNYLNKTLLLVGGCV